MQIAAGAKKDVSIEIKTKALGAMALFRFARRGVLRADPPESRA